MLYNLKSIVNFKGPKCLQIQEEEGKAERNDLRNNDPDGCQDRGALKIPVPIFVRIGECLPDSPISLPMSTPYNCTEEVGKEVFSMARPLYGSH